MSGISRAAATERLPETHHTKGGGSAPSATVAAARRTIPLPAYFALLVALFVAAAAAAAVYVHVQTRRDARHTASADARFAAGTAAKELGHGITVVRATIAGLAGNPQIGATIDHPAGCTLTYGGLSGVPDRSHLDLVARDGRIVCSSRRQGVGKTYTRAGWLERAPKGPALAAPVVDTTTGAHVAISTVPVPGHGFVASVDDLTALGAGLAALYGAGKPVEFLVTSRDGRTILARSIDPQRWIGRTLPGGPPASGVERRDVDGKKRLYEEAMVPGVGWRFFAGEDVSAALAAGKRLERRQLAIILIGLLTVLAAALLTYRRVARPIAELSQAVRSSSMQTPRPPVPLVGPAEVTALAGDINGLIESVDRELLQRQLSEAAHRDSEARSRAMLDSALDAIITIDEQGAIVEFNPAAEGIFGRSRADVIGAQMAELIVPPSLREAHYRGLARYLETGEGPILGRRLELTALRADGTEFPIELAISRVALDGPPMFTGYLRDVSDQRKLEEQLRQAQKMEAIGNLAGGIAHDFNNILMVIRTCGAILSKRLGGEADSEVEQIDSAAQRAADLTHQLLAFSRQQVLRPELTDLNAAVEETRGLLDRLIGEHIEVTYELDPEVPTIVVDRGQLGQVLLNLGVNARDAMETGGMLSIRTGAVSLGHAFLAEHEDVPPGSYALLQVTDSGIGMDQETQRRVFDPFFTTKETGTGLGLATVYGIVKQSGGHIWLYSELGMGATFKVYFPATTTPGAAAPAPRTVTALEGDETILLVEDDAAVRPLVAGALRTYGYTVLEAASGQQALEIADAHRGAIDLLLTDVVMPKMNGRELAEELTGRDPALRVLFTSGYPTDTVLRHGIAEAKSNYIEKPYLPDDLARKIRQVMD